MVFFKNAAFDLRLRLVLLISQLLKKRKEDLVNEGKLAGKLQLRLPPRACCITMQLFVVFSVVLKVN